MNHQVSCKANTQNAGNWYSFPAATAGSNIFSGNAPNSICPKGWQLTVNAAAEVKSWYYLIRNTYSISDQNDSKIRMQPLSFIRSGNYDDIEGLLRYRASYGNYQSSTADTDSRSYLLYFSSDYLDPQRHSDYYHYKRLGYSLRCVRHVCYNIVMTNKQGGKITIEPGTNVLPHEITTAKALMEAGYNVQFKRKKEGYKIQSADILMNGKIWEIKSPKGSTLDAVERNLRRAKER